jgi:SnoaL-like protein
LTKTRALRVAGVVALAAVAFLVWSRWGSNDERIIRGRLEALRTEVNRSTPDGLANVARAVSIGSYFTEDVVVDLGESTPPIRGRVTLMGMAERLQPRTAAFRMDLDDVGVEMTPGATTADTTLTVSFIRRSMSTGEESRDAREFALGLTKADGTWRIARVTAIDVLR